MRLRDLRAGGAIRALAGRCAACRRRGARTILGLVLLLALAGAPGGEPARDSGLLAVARAADAPARIISPSEPCIAITIDDLPWAGDLGPGDTRPQATARILDALRRHRVAATGFVVCERMIDGAVPLRQWLAAGMELGNHSTTHSHLDGVALSEWTNDVCGCRDQLAAFTGSAVRWFRYPFLQTGATIARRDSALAIVHGCGLAVAPVSVDTGEWALVKPYVAALRDEDLTRARAIGQAYVEHLLAALEHYRAIARARAGRDVAQVLLLHANALAADFLDTLLVNIEQRGWRFVALDTALADSVYALPDDYAGPIGMSWLYRFAPAIDSVWAWDDQQVEMMQARFGR
jgi:peptidoglycan-N-acetylglucosamine deacetylase